MKRVIFSLLFIVICTCSAFAQSYTTIIYKSGDKYVGQVDKDRRRQGQGTYTSKDFTYTGGFFCGNFHGQGVIVFTTGERYEGEFRHGKYSGFGKFVNADGTSYVGEFKYSYRDGMGTYTYYDGSTYTGHWKLGKKDGEGTFKQKMADSFNTFSGKYVNEKLNDDNARISYYNGHSYEGGYRDDAYNGHGKYSWPDGSTFEGEFVKGLMQGSGKYSDANGSFTAIWKENSATHNGQRYQLSTVLGRHIDAFSIHTDGENGYYNGDEAVLTNDVLLEIDNVVSMEYDFSNLSSVQSAFRKAGLNPLSTITYKISFWKDERMTEPFLFPKWKGKLNMHSDMNRADGTYAMVPGVFEGNALQFKTNRLKHFIITMPETILDSLLKTYPYTFDITVPIYVKHEFSNGGRVFHTIGNWCRPHRVLFQILDYLPCNGNGHEPVETEEDLTSLLGDDSPVDSIKKPANPPTTVTPVRPIGTWGVVSREDSEKCHHIWEDVSHSTNSTVGSKEVCYVEKLEIVTQCKLCGMVLPNSYRKEDNCSYCHEFHIRTGEVTLHDRYKKIDIDIDTLQMELVPVMRGDTLMGYVSKKCISQKNYCKVMKGTDTSLYDANSDSTAIYLSYLDCKHYIETLNSCIYEKNLAACMVPVTVYDAIEQDPANSAIKLDMQEGYYERTEDIVDDSFNVCVESLGGAIYHPEVDVSDIDGKKCFRIMVYETEAGDPIVQKTDQALKENRAPQGVKFEVKKVSKALEETDIYTFVEMCRRCGYLKKCYGYTSKSTK